MLKINCIYYSVGYWLSVFLLSGIRYFSIRYSVKKHHPVLGILLSGIRLKFTMLYDLIIAVF